MGTPDLTLQECCERWGVNSRNSVKARAAALGVELRRESSTRTVWPREDIPLGDELHEHLQAGGTLRDFPGAVAPATSGALSSSPSKPSVPAVAGGSDAMALAMLQLLQQQQAAQPPAALNRARAMAAAADERLPLTHGELAELMGLPVEEVEKMKAGQTVYGFKLRRVGTTPQKGAPDRRAWLLERIVADKGITDLVDLPNGVSAISALPPVTAELKRTPGFIAAAIEAETTVMGRVELPGFCSSLPSVRWYQ